MFKSKFFNKSSENGSVVYMFLVMFFMLSLFLLGIYSFIVNQANKSSDSMSELNEFAKQSSLVESIKHNYTSDFFNDISYDDMSEKLTGTELGDELELSYNNYVYYFSNLGTAKYSGKLDWLKFRYYNNVSDEKLVDLYPELESEFPDETYDLREKRVYEIKDNFNSSNFSNVDYFDLSTGRLLVRTPLYIKANFDTDVSRFYLLFKSSNNSKIYSFMNRVDGDNIYKITDVPYSTYEILMYSDYDENLGSSSFSILKSREIDIEVFNKIQVGKSYNKGKKVLGKTLKIYLGRTKNKVVFTDKDLLDTPKTE